MQNIKPYSISISLRNKLIRTFAYQPKIKFLGPRHLIPKQTSSNPTNESLGQKNERKLKDISEYKHEYSSYSRKTIDHDEMEAINSGGVMFNWRKIPKIKIVKIEED